jgi:F-type H+-transporting ATPase subunit gamma
MSETTISLKQKLDTASELHSVVRTMKALAASSIGQYEKSVKALESYTRTLDLGLSVCLKGIKSLPRFSETSRMIIVFGSDQGLVGQFNNIIVAEVVKDLKVYKGKTIIWAVGSRTYSHLLEAGLNPKGHFDVPNSVNVISSLIGKILVEYEADVEKSELYLFYNHAQTSVSYLPVKLRLLPLDASWSDKYLNIPWPTKQVPEVLGADTFKALIREYIFITLFRSSAESLKSENASRLAAMQRAEKNIDELLENLTREFNHLRQSRIDEELFDVVSAFEILK